jgi:hypothetical protein
LVKKKLKKPILKVKAGPKKLRGLNPLVNCTDRATAACRRR